MQRMRRSLAEACLVVCCLSVLAACGLGDSDGGPDGVPDVERWRAERDLRVGSVDDPDETLTYIRDLEVGADGTIYTLHRQERLVRTFDSAGTFRGVIGGEGGGPGEFQSPLSMGWVADTLWVLDTLPAVPLGNNLWAVYDPQNPYQGGSYGQQPFADGPLWSYVPGERATLRVDREAPRSADDARFWVTKLTFSGDTLFTREFSFTPEPVTQAEVDSVLDARAGPIGDRGFLGATEAQAREWAERTLYRPPFKSLVREMTVGRDGSIWLQRTVEADTAFWLVLDASGEPRAEVSLPAGFDLLEADRGQVWGQEQDELDVPYLVRYRVGPADGDAG